MKRPVLLLLLFVFEGCSHQAEQDERNLDSFLVNERIDRIEFINDNKEKTNVFVGDRAAAVIQAFGPTNRAKQNDSGWRKIDFSARVFFYSGSNYVMGIHYTPDLKAFAYRKYYFAPKGTNDVRKLFE
jgi:hypothetical protein